MCLLKWPIITFIIHCLMNKGKGKPPKNAGPTSINDQEVAEFNVIPFDLLSINDHKSSCNDSEALLGDKDYDSYFSVTKHPDSIVPPKSECCQKKVKIIQKRQKDCEEDKRANLNKKRRIAYLQHRVQELQKEVHSLRRNEHYCMNCREKLPAYYRERISQLIQPEEPCPNVAGDQDFGRSHSKDTFQFEKIDFHTPLMQTQEMEEKMWIFLGTMLIAMGSKVMDFDGTINTFKILKDSVDRVRRQVEKGQNSLGIDFFCCKEELHEPGAFIDGVNFDPFYTGKEDLTHGNFSLEGVKVESVQQYELFYDYKYKFNIKYDALLTIMEYARDKCTLS